MICWKWKKCVKYNLKMSSLQHLLYTTDICFQVYYLVKHFMSRLCEHVCLNTMLSSGMIKSCLSSFFSLLKWIDVILFKYLLTITIIFFSHKTLIMFYSSDILFSFVFFIIFHLYENALYIFHIYLFLSDYYPLNIIFYCFSFITF